MAVPPTVLAHRLCLSVRLSVCRIHSLLFCNALKTKGRKVRDQKTQEQCVTYEGETI